MATLKELNSQLASAQKKHGNKSQAAGRIQYKINQLNKDSKGTAVKTKDGKAVKSKTGVVRQNDASKKVRTITKRKTPLTGSPSAGTGTVKKVVKSKNYSSAGYDRPVSTLAKKVTPKKVVKKVVDNSGSKTMPVTPKKVVKKVTPKKVVKKVTPTKVTPKKTFNPTNPKVLENLSVVAKKQADQKKIQAANLAASTPDKIAEQQAANRKANANRIAELQGKGKFKKASKVTQEEKSDVYSKEKPSFLSGIIDKMKTTQATRKRLASAKKAADKKAAVRKEAYDKRMAVKAKREKDAKDAKAKAKQIADKKSLYEKRLADKKKADKKKADKKAADKKAADKKLADKKLAAETYWNNTQGKVRTRQAARNKKLKESK